VNWRGSIAEAAAEAERTGGSICSSCEHLALEAGVFRCRINAAPARNGMVSARQRVPMCPLWNGREPGIPHVEHEIARRAKARPKVETPPVAVEIAPGQLALL